MYRYFVMCWIFLAIAHSSFGQGFAFGPKGGLSLASQNFNGYSRQVLPTGHASFYIESLSEENKNALFAQLGYHVRGSTIRTTGYTNQNGNFVNARSQNSVFGNVALYFGGKQKNTLGLNSKWYFDFALRAEYTAHVQLPDFYSNLEDQVNRFVYGVTVGGGIEMMFSELVGGIFEVHVNPDLSSQIFIPAQQAVDDPNRIIPERRIMNVTIEVSLGLRLLRKIVYID